MSSLKHKIALIFGGMLIIMIAVSALSMLLLNRYTDSIERMFRDNYDSVIYVENLKAMIAVLDEVAQQSVFDERSFHLTEGRYGLALERFSQNLERERANVTLPGEGQLVKNLDATWQDYLKVYDQLTKMPVSDRRDIYRLSLAPLSTRIRDYAQQIININLANVVTVNGSISSGAALAQRTMLILMVSGVVFAVVFVSLTLRSLLKPLNSLTTSIREIERGNLDLSVSISSHDEIGKLQDAFNAMAAKLREFRTIDRARLVRVQKTTQIALNTFPAAAIIVSAEAKIELANEMARKRFELLPGQVISEGTHKGLWALFNQAKQSLAPVQPVGYESTIQIFDQGTELFYLPQAVPIIFDGAFIGVTIVISDVTHLRRIDEMKSGLISVVSHELKTPLTSIRMAAYLLSGERIGTLNAKQMELALATRDDAERLSAIIDNLLDMSRIESGHGLLELSARTPEQLLRDAQERHRLDFRERGVSLVTKVESNLAPVLVDAKQLGLVFANLLNNALKYTPSGGLVTMEAALNGHFVEFRVIDTGSGIKSEDLTKVFDRFYRSKEQGGIHGAGLGLAIAKEIVQAHGGDIAVESTPGVGTQFRFTLKVAGSPSSTEEEKDS